MGLLLSPSSATSSPVPSRASPVPCGKASCRCAQPNAAGRGPHVQLTPKVDGKTATQNLPSLAAIHKAETEIAQYRKFRTLKEHVIFQGRRKTGHLDLGAVEMAVRTAMHQLAGGIVQIPDAPAARLVTAEERRRSFERVSFAPAARGAMSA